MSPPRVIRAPLVERREVAPGYNVLVFDLPSHEAPIVAQPGQFAMVRGATWGGAPLLPRPMSLLTDGRRPSILIKVVGEGTARMARASLGEPYDLLAPLGVPFSIAEIAENKPDTNDGGADGSEAAYGRRTPVLVAGGVGVVPLVYLARMLAAAGTRPITLFGGRTRFDLPLDDALAAAGELRVATEDGSRGSRGRVTTLLERLLEVANDSVEAATGRWVVYACGPNPMMAAVAAICARREVPCYVSLEAPMACGFGVCLGCNVPRVGGGFTYVCTGGPCVDAATVAWDRLGSLTGGHA